ncbi:MAG: TetR/AcrR family transcriptional regulator [Alphaproteobacteria bacterium]
MSDKNKSGGRGRPRKFDEAAVLAKAGEIFLAQGFEATSYDKIGLATGLSKPSLYNSFGDKAALFARIIEDYAALAHGLVMDAVAGKATLAEAAATMLQEAAKVYAPVSGHSVGCLLIGTSLPAAVVDEGVQNILSGFVTEMDSALAAVIARDYAVELKQRGKSADQMAQLYSSLLFALAVRARMGLTRRELLKVARDLASTV